MPISTFRNPLVYALSAALMLSPAYANAQLGGLVKKATDKVAKRGAEKVGSGDAKLGSAFNAEGLDRVLNALELTASARTKADSIGRVVEPIEKQLADAVKTGHINY